MPNKALKEIIANRKLITAGPHTPVFELAKTMSDSHVDAIVILDEDYLVGIVTERDLVSRVLALGKSPKTTTAKDVMTYSPMTADHEKPFRYALHVMDDGNFRHLPVTRNGQVIGVVSARDALSMDLKEFEADNAQKEHLYQVLA